MLDVTKINDAVIYQNKEAQQHITEYGKLQQKIIRDLIRPSESHQPRTPKTK